MSRTPMGAGPGMAPPRVSVIIPTYNHAALLPHALDSVFGQEGDGFELEVIVIDDGSTDSTPDVVKGYPRVRYLRLPTNRGVSAARNAGLAASTGRYVAFLDDDDVWLPFKLGRQVASLEARPEAGVVYGQNIVTFENEVGVWPDAGAPSGRIFERLLMGNFVPIRTVLVRRTALDVVGGFDESLTVYEVNDLWLRLAFHVPFIFQPGPVAIYRRRPDGLYIRGIVSGQTEAAAMRVVDKALALLPRTPASRALEREARVRVRLGFAAELEAIGDHHGFRRYVGVLLRELGRDGHEPRIRRAVGSQLLRLALASGAPERELSEWHRSTGGGEAPGARAPRSFWADVWLRLAQAQAREGQWRAALRDVARALMADPTFLLRSSFLRGRRVGARLMGR